MMRTLSVIALLTAFAAAAHAGDAKPRANAGKPQAIALTGVKEVSELWIANLRTYPAMLVPVTQVTDRGPLSATFKGALLWQVIDRAGWMNGAGKNAQIRHTILVTGKDGYAAAVSEGEIDPKLENKYVIIAYEKDGKPLDAPRLVVPGDLHAARSVHDVVSIAVQ
ncbi:MAG: hypothetical protein ACTHPD_15325 [Rhizomicrobium sp.]